MKALVLVGRCGAFLAKLPQPTLDVDVKVEEWYGLNHSITVFSASLPFENIAVDRSAGRLDHFRLIASLIPAYCTIVLHEPLIPADDDSMRMCRMASTSIATILRVSALLQTHNVLTCSLLWSIH